MLISFTTRIGGSIGIFLIGSQLIYYGMKFNGSARLNSPVWGFVSGLHDLIVYGVLAAAICAFALFVVLPLVFAMLPDEKSKQAKPEEDTPLPPIVLTPEQIEKKRRRYEQMLQEARELQEQEKKRIEAQRQIEEKRKQEIIQARRERSARAAAHDALDDFL